MKELEKKALLELLDRVTLVSCIVIVFCVIFAIIYVYRQKHQNTVLKKKKWIEQIPSLISTLGVLGTFIGITIGLYHFDTYNLDDSIPLLLSGLKTAFITSLAGMAGSIILNRIVNKILDDMDAEESESEKNTKKIVDAIAAFQRELTNDTMKKFRSDVNDNLVKITKTLVSMNKALDQIKDDVEEIKGYNTELKEGLDEKLPEISNKLNSATSEIPQILGVALTATASISKIDNLISNIEKSTKDLSGKIEDISEDISSNQNKS